MTRDGQRATARLARAALIAAILHAMASQCAFSAFGPDKVSQVAAAQALVDGRGLSLVRLDEQLERQSIPIVGWPPGYSVAVAFGLLMARDPFWATVLVDWASVIALLASWWALLGLVPPSGRDRTRLILFGYLAIAFVPTTALSSSELLALALLCASCALVGASVSGGRQHPWLAALLIVLSCSVRFAYWPLVLALPAALASRLRTDASIRRLLVIMTAVPVLGVAAVAFHQRVATGAVTYFVARHQMTGWFFCNLRRLHPFPVSVLGLDQFASEAVVKLGLAPSLLLLLWVPAAVVAAAYLSHLFAICRQSEGIDDRAAFLHGMGAAIGLLTVATLVLLGVRHPLEPASWTLDGRWSYLEEPRYFAPTWFFLMAAVVATVIVAPRSTWHRQLRAATLAVLVVAAVLGASRTCWRWATYPTRASLNGWYPDAVREERRALWRDLRDLGRTNDRLVFCDTDIRRRDVAALAGVAAIDALDCPESWGSAQVPIVTSGAPRRPCNGGAGASARLPANLLSTLSVQYVPSACVRPNR